MSDFGEGSSKDASRVPPHNQEAERSVLGAMLVQNETIDLIRDVGLEPRDFYIESHQKVFETALDVSEKRQPVDLVTITSALRDRGWFEQVGGTETLTGLFDDAFAVGNVTHYARIVRDKAVQRRMIGVCSEIIQTAFDGVEDTEDFLDESETRVYQVSDLKASKSFSELRSVLLENMSAIEELALKKSDVTGISMGFQEFDRLTTGLHPGQVMILAARPGMGKTSWFISALQHAALSDDAVVALFSLEMSKEELGFRFLSGLARIDAKRLKIGKLHDEEWHKLADAADRLAKSRIFIDDTGGLTVNDIRSRCRRLLSGEKKLDLVVVDYLQLMRGPRGGKGEMSREREISEISRGLKELSKELKVPVVALSQLNRSVESRQDKRPGLSDLRESGAIEQDADLVCFIHREDYYHRDTEERGVAELIVAKNRSGPVDTVRLAWLPQYTLFANISPSSPGTPVFRNRPESGDITL